MASHYTVVMVNGKPVDGTAPKPSALTKRDRTTLHARLAYWKDLEPSSNVHFAEVREITILNPSIKPWK